MVGGWKASIHNFLLGEANTWKVSSNGGSFLLLLLFSLPLISARHWSLWSVYILRPYFFLGRLFQGINQDEGGQGVLIGLLGSYTKPFPTIQPYQKSGWHYGFPLSDSCISISLSSEFRQKTGLLFIRPSKMPTVVSCSWLVINLNFKKSLK